MRFEYYSIDGAVNCVYVMIVFATLKTVASVVTVLSTANAEKFCVIALNASLKILRSRIITELELFLLISHIR
jgi:hypothetical protein